MAGVELATGYVNLVVSTRGLGKDIAKGFAPVEKQAADTGKRAGSKFSGGMGAAFKGLGGLFAGAMAGIAVKDFIGDALGEARESQKVGALTASIIKSTGGAAKVTADQVGALAESISRKTGKDDEAIQTGANLLLTFKNVRNEAGKGNDVFNQATQAAVDLSAAGFGSVEGASKMLGKALNDPIKGISALGRAGVTFTEQQKKQIEQMVKSGDVLGAQKIIMAEVESQVGGAAAATATAGDKAKVTFDNLKEAAGNKLLPIVDNLATKFTTLVDEFENGTGTGGKLKDVFNGIKDAVSAVVGFVQKYSDILVPLAGAILAIVGAMKAWKMITTAIAVVQGILNAVMMMNPIGLIVLAIVGLVAALVLAYKKSETFRAIVDAVWKAVKTAISAVVDWFVKTAWPWLRDTFEKIKAGFTTVKDTLGRAWQAIKDAAQTAIRTVVMKFLDMVGTIINGAAKAFGWVPGLGGKLKTAATEFDKFKGRVNTALGGVKDKTVTLGVNFKAGTKLAYDARHQTVANGGLVKRAGGGVIPGPWAGPKADNVLGVTDAGVPIAWVNPREYILPVHAADRLERNHPGALEYMRKTGRLPGFASGGLALKSSLANRNTIDDAIDSRTLDTVARSAKMLMAANAAQSGVGVGSKAFGWRALWAIVHRLIPGIQLTSSYRPGAITALGNKSLHGMGRAIDVAPPSMAAFNTILRAFPNATQLFYGPADGRTLLRGKPWHMDPVTKRGHYDHIHLAMNRGGMVPTFDQGGTLRPGLNMVNNATGADEHLRPVGRDGGLDLSDSSLYRLAAILRDAPMRATITTRAVDEAMAVGL